MDELKTGLMSIQKKSLGHSKYNECNSKPLKYYNLRLSKQLYDDGSQGPKTVPFFQISFYLTKRYISVSIQGKFNA